MPSFRYIIGNSPKLPRATEVPDTATTIQYEHLKVQLEMLQEEQILVILTDAPLSMMQLSKIEYALLNYGPKTDSSVQHSNNSSSKGNKDSTNNS